MSFMGSKPPQPGAGDISPITEALRPPIGLSKKECQRARRLLRKGFDIPNIAIILHAAEEDVRLAVSTTRTRTPWRSRTTLNVTTAVGQFVAKEARNGEPRWETVDRLFAELIAKRT